MLKKIDSQSFLPVRLIFNLVLLTFVSIKTTFPNLGDTKIAYLDISFNSNVPLIRNMYGMSDAGSYLDIALSLASFNNIQPEQYFYIHTWSPGQSIVLALAILASKFTFPLYVNVFILNYLIWVFIIIFLTKHLSSGRQIVLFYSFYLTFLISSDFVYYFYTNMFHSESIGNSLLFIALMYLSWLIKNQILNWLKYAFVGFVLGFSILVRYTSETGLLLLMLLLLMWLILQLFLSSSLKSRLRIRQILHLKILKLTFLSVLVALLTTIPWRILNFTLYDMDTLRLSNASSWTIYGVWALENSPEAEYWSGYGSNWACKIDPIKCNSLNNAGLKSLTPKTISTEALKSVIKNPTSYLGERFKFMKIQYLGDGFLDITQYQKYFSVLALFSGAYILRILFKKRFWDFDNFIISVIWISFIFNQILMYSITHYEYRYFIIFKFLIFGYIFSLYFHATNRSKISGRVN